MSSAILTLCLCGALLFSPAASANGEVLGFKTDPVQTYDAYGDPDVEVPAAELGDVSAIRIIGVFKEFSLVVLQLENTQIAVYSRDIIVADPGRLAELLGTAPNAAAVTCFAKAGAARGQPSGAKTRATKGFGGAFCG